MKQSVLLMIMLLILSGCNTIAGMGEDLEAAGGSIEESAEKEKRD
ncbi:MAG: entericidin A/B family lipoprotein [Pseudomonadota bacterium]|nr:entericidin A/B family lipoprotein [Pseudomonadota bacterium]